MYTNHEMEVIKFEDRDNCVFTNLNVSDCSDIVTCPSQDCGEVAFNSLIGDC